MMDEKKFSELCLTYRNVSNRDPVWIEVAYSELLNFVQEQREEAEETAASRWLYLV